MKGDLFDQLMFFIDVALLNKCSERCCIGFLFDCNERFDISSVSVGSCLTC